MNFFRHKKRVLANIIFSTVALTFAGMLHAESAPADLEFFAKKQAITEDKTPPEKIILEKIEAELKKDTSQNIFIRSSIPSMFFTPSQYALLREARLGFNTRLPTKSELANAGASDAPNAGADAVIRDISLGGIAFNTPDDWTIWLNGARVTPDAMPKEAIDLRVYHDYVELKWFDAVTNQIFPVRLRTNQKFNLDARIFLPG